MTTSTEDTGNAQATGAQPKPNKKATRAPRRAPVAPAKAKSGRKASPAKKAANGTKAKAAAKPEVAREGSKTAKILDLLKRPGGVTSQELRKATGWQPHSVRGFPVRDGRQEDGSDRHVHQGHRRGAHLQNTEVKDSPTPSAAAREGGGFFCGPALHRGAFLNAGSSPNLYGARPLRPHP